MTAFSPKRYQQETLEAAAAFFRHCGEGIGCSEAFGRVTYELFEQSLPYRQLPGFPRELPWFCLRVPTGGGKTWLGAKAVKLVNQLLLRTEFGVFLWLTPTRPICLQTRRGLKNPDHPLHAALAEAGPVTVVDLEEAQSLTRATFDTSTVVIVATRQAFQVGDRDLRKVHDNNGALAHHFDNLPPGAEQALLHHLDEEGNDTVPASLVNVLRMRRPFVIVDEAHNNRTELAFETLANFLPSGILELTATPDQKKKPSNVLYSVSALELKNEDMIKLPIYLETEPDWRQCLAKAIAKREELEARADALWTPGLKRMTPLMLIQAEPHYRDRETLHCERVKEELIANFNIMEEQICIATGEEKGLEAIEKAYPEGLRDESCPVRYVITQKALAEGWDCPTAYVLVGLAQVGSATVAEQLLGRVMRQPDAKRLADEQLNCAHAFVVAPNFADIAQSLRDQLVNVGGLEPKHAAEFVIPAKPAQLQLHFKRFDISVPEGIEVKPIPSALAQKVQWNSLTRQLTVGKKLENNEICQLQQLVSDPAVREQIAEMRQDEAEEQEKTPAEQGVKIVIPQLSLLQEDGKKRMPFIDAAGQLNPVLKIMREDTVPSDADLAILSVEKGERGKIDLNDSGHLESSFMQEVQCALEFVMPPENWDQTRLAAWLCNQIDTPFMAHGEKFAFVSAYLCNLEKDMPLTMQVRKKSILRNILETRLDNLKERAVENAAQLILFGPDAGKRLKVDDEYVFALEQYLPIHLHDPEKSGFGNHKFRKHHFPQIGKFDSQEEFECAVQLDNEAIKGRIKSWVRNIAKSPYAFSLTRIGGRFYPDFVCILPDDSLLVVEYKGADRWDMPRVKGDRAIGRLWAELSGGRCKFLMLKNREWYRLEDVLKGQEE